ncbi:hypothetical protein V5N11_015776 [Cardamine amara subsp. amara]|uniref:Endonuclease/exonuclease/phosphatase n=1 Tax=Cardamine amara subsp. amara TaxID=228776 RepID=A0ABD1AD89_CARAN
MVFDKSRQHITCGIHWLERDIAFTATFVYGANLRHERNVLWDQLRILAAGTPLRYSPWIVLGDFNQTLLPSEHSNSEDHQVYSGGRRELFNCLQDCGLTDIPSQGPYLHGGTTK